MNSKMSRRAGAAAPIRLVEKRSDQPVDAPPRREERNSLDKLVAFVAARWRGHEPEIAIMGTVTLILAIVAVFAGAAQRRLPHRRLEESRVRQVGCQIGKGKLLGLDQQMPEPGRIRPRSAGSGRARPGTPGRAGRC